MQYTINEIHGGQIKVTYADGSWANVRVKSDDSAAMIDERVGAFTSEYVVAETPNTNIAVGDIRSTVDPVAAQKARDEAAKNSKVTDADAYALNWGNTRSYMGSATAYYLALKLAGEGDTSFLEMINTRLQEIQDDPDFNLADLKQAFNDALIV